MYLPISQLAGLGVTPQEVAARLQSGEWKTWRGAHDDDGEGKVLLASLPPELQHRWARALRISSSSPRVLSLLAEAEGYGLGFR